MDKNYTVSYLDVVKGGSGQVIVPADKLHEWLEERPGVMIRKLSPSWLTLDEYERFRTLRPASISTI